MGRTEELSDFQSDTVKGCHLSNMSVRQISALLELPRSTVSADIVKWKRLGATTAQPRSGRPHKLTERDCRVLKRVAWKNRLPSVAILTTEFQTDLEATSAQTLFVESLMKWISMAKQLHISLRSPCAMPSFSWSGVNLTTIGLWSSGNTFSGVVNHASPSGSLMDEFGFGGCQENATCPNALCYCKVCWRKNNGLGLFFMVRARPLSSSEGKS